MDIEGFTRKYIKEEDEKHVKEKLKDKILEYKKIKPQKADQFSLGYFNDVFKTKYQITAEFFYKYLMNQIDYKDHANLLFNPLIEGELRFGKAWSYGTEWMIRKNGDPV